jgi:Fe-S cluster assembly protein SufD
VDHNAPETKSNINFRVALKDRASSAYMGTIKVSKVAQKTESFQSNKNLLLGSEAKADSIPKLEILADDVKCSHGATVGPVDKEQLFYLTCRGLTPAEAEELVVTGFFRQIFDTCTVTGATDYISELLADKIHSRRE